MTATLAPPAQPSIRAVTYRYPGSDQPALDAVSMTLGEGITAIAGASGSGKSTLLRLLNGLVPNFHGGRIRGQVTVAGMDAMRTSTARLAREVGFVFQDPETQLVRANVLDEVAFSLENTAVPEADIGDRVEWAMAAIGISDLAGRTTASLSGGERQRLAIAAAMALRPAVLALDEPTSQLDPEGAAEVLRACAELAASGTAVVVSEHRCAGLLHLADHLAVMAAGRLNGPGPVRELAMRMDDPPQVVALARAMGWSRVPLTVEEARDLAPSLTRRPPGPLTITGKPAWALSSCTAGHDGAPVFEAVDVGGVAGEVSVLVGPNGGGKTTLLRAIAGLHGPLAGSAWRQPGRVAYLPQDPAVLLHRRSVQDEVDYTLARAGSDEPRDLVLRRLGMADLASRYPGDLSSGQRQRAALAAILAGSPGLVLLDEPTRGMDAAARAALIRILLEMAASGASVVVATHDLDLAAHLADRVLLVGGGSVLDAGPPALALSGAGPYVTDIGRLYPGGPVTVEQVLACL